MGAEPLYELTLTTIFLGSCVALLAGFVKGAVGFAMPMIMISGLGSFFAPELALAGLIIPTLLTNLWQALRQGVGAAHSSARKHWRYLVILLALILIIAQFVLLLSASVFLLALGIPVVFFAILQLLGWRPSIGASNQRKAEVLYGTFAGITGGFSGVWGPPTVLYLTALDTPKVEQVRVQGVLYGLGAVALAFGHLNSGVLNAETAKFSALLTIPALLGMSFGFSVQDKLDQVRFRKITLIVLVIAGLNLIRRAVFG